MQTAVIQGFRLSPQQEHVWRAHRDPAAAGLVVQHAVELGGAPDPTRLEDALRLAVERHEILRTTFQVLPGMSLAVQVIAEADDGAGYELSRHRLDGGDPALAFAVVCERARRTPFDLTRRPLLRAAWIEEPSRNRLLLTLPALVADAAGAGHLANEIKALYEAGPSGTAADGPIQYADVAEILHEWLGADGPEAAGSWWRRQDLSGLSRARLGRDREGVDTGIGRVQAWPDEARQDRLWRLADQLDVPIRVLMLAAWQITLWHSTLWHSTGEEEIFVGTGFDGRTCAEFEDALGLFARYLPVRCRLDASTTLGDLIPALSQAMAEASEWQDGFPVTEVEKLLGARGDGARWPFGFDHDPSGAEYAALDLFDLRLSVAERGESLRLDLYHDLRRIDSGEARRVLDRYLLVLDGLIADPDATLAELDVLSAAERRELLADFNRTAAPLSEVCAHELFDEQARRAPEATALVDLSEGPEGRRWTHAELAARSNRLAHRLRALGAGPESRVGLCLERSAGMVESLLAVLKAGGAYVPLDPGYPAERLGFLLEDAGISVLLTRRGLLARLPAPDPRLRVLCLDDETEAEEIARASDRDPSPAAGPDNLAYVIYTSGSTGRPKGVGVHHRGLVNYLLWAREAYAAGEGGGAPVHSSLGFDLTVTGLLVPLAAGTAVTLLPEEPGVGALASALRDRGGFSLVKITPAHLELLRQVLPRESCAGSVRALVIGGEALSAESLAFWREHAPATRLINEYGPTETVVGCCVHEVGAGDPASGPVSIGRPIANVRLYVANPALKPVPAGVPGELWIGGVGVARGYLGRPDLTADRFRPDPFAEGPDAGERLYRTGDLVRRLPDGGLEYLGRIDQQVKIRGFRIEPGEIEAALTSHPAVAEAAVVVREHDGGKRLVAYVVPREGQRPAAAGLRAFLGERLPEHMVPLAFAILDALPLTLHGKLDRQALPEPRTGEEAVYAPPRTLEEELLAEIWAHVLGVDRVGIDDLFFSLGGDSIRSVQVLSLARQRGLDLTVQELFQHPTIRGLAARVRAGAGEPEAAGEPFAAVSALDRERLPSGLVDAYPLARLQAGMLFHSELDAGSAIYHDLHSFHLRGRFDATLLQTAVDQVVGRHAALRTSFDLSGFSEPLQLVHAEAAVPVAIDDLRHLSSGEQRESVEKWLAAERNRGFDWSRPPMVRFHVHLRSEDTFQFTLSFHHSVLDGWSAASLLIELFRRYASLLEGVAPPPAVPPSASFRGFVELERRLLESPEAREFWSRQLDGATLARLPRRGLGGEEARARVLEVPLPEEVELGLKRLARTSAVPLKSALLAAHFRVMSLLTGRADVVTGVFANGRPEQADGDQVLGLFLNTLPLRLRLPGGTWSELVYAVFDLERATLPFRCFPLAELQRMQGGGPLFETACNFLHYHVYQGAQEVAGLEAIERSGYEETNFALEAQFSLNPFTGRLHLALNYRTSELDAEQVEAIGGYYRRALEMMAADPEGRYDGAVLLSGAERRQMLAEWGRGGPGAGPAVCFDPLFREQALRTPDAVAVALAGEELTYAELDRRAGRMARALADAGVGPDEVVPLLAERGPDFLAAVLGVFRAGGAYLPLDPLHPMPRVLQILAASGARRVVAVRAFAPELARALEGGRLLVLEDLLAAEDGEAVEARAVPSDLAYVIYTSGSTGVPKGAMLEQRGMVNHLWAKVAELGLGPSDVVAQTASQCFDISVWQFLAPLLVGGRVQVFPDEVAHDALRLPREVERHGVTVLETVPSLLRLLLAELRERDADRPELRRLRWLIPTGEALPPDLCREWLWLYPAVPLLNAYGPTECSDDVTHHRIAASPGPEVARVPIGRPVQGLALYVLDPWLQPLPEGVAGELFVGGVGVGRGYLGDGGRTADAWRPDPFSGEPGARLYRTGDLARFRPDSAIEFLGRLDDQVKIRGHRIELGEVEARLALHPGVRQCAVMARADQGDARLVAYLVPEGEAPEPAALRAFLKERLPEAMVPSAFVALAALPLTPNGKLDRRALPAPEPEAGAAESVSAPRTPVETLLAGLWADVLGRPSIGPDENFFELGGHSLLATQVISRVRGVFGVELPLRALFEAPTVAGLALRIEAERWAGGRAEAPPLELLPLREGLPLSFAQERLWFLHQLDPASPVYNIPFALRLEGELNEGALAASLDEVVARHESLRTTLGQSAGQPVQRVAPPAPLPLPRVDLGALPAGLREEETRRLIAGESWRPFDLEQGPLLRATLLRLGERRYGLLVNMHHVISDGWSVGVLIREVTALYAAFLQGRPSPLPPLPVQYPDFAVWQRRWLSGEVLARQVGFWRERLAGAPLALDLPADRPRPPVPSGRGGRRTTQLTPELSAALVALSRREGTTLFMTLAAAFDVLLHRHTGREDLLVGTDVAGRNRAETEPLIGFFVNQMVLRADLAGDPPFRALLSRVRESTLEAYAHQDLPFEKLVEELQPARDLSRSPVFQVAFLLQNVPAVSLELPGLSLDPLPIGGGIARYDLTVAATETPAGLRISTEHSTDLFDHTTAERLLGHFATLLQAVAVSPGMPLSEIPFLTEGERQQVLIEWNDSAARFAEGTFLQVFEARVAAAPDAVAASCGEERLTYTGLSRRAGRLAGALAAGGVEPGEVVPLLADRGLDFLAAMLGLFEAGAAYLPLDPLHPLPRTVHLVESSGARRVVAQRRFAPALEAALVDLPVEDRPRLLVLEDLLEGPAADPAGSRPDDLAYVIYTSGSTGAPKGAMVEQRGMLNHLWAKVAALELTEADVVAQTASQCFDISVWQFLAALLAGGQVRVFPLEVAHDPLRLLDEVESAGVTVLETVPSLLRLMLENLDGRGGRRPSLSRLRWLIPTGEALPADLCRQWHRLYPEVPLLNAYGPTECSDDVTHHPMRVAPGETEPIPIGRPVANLRLHVLGKDLRPLPAGVPGELFVAGAGVGRGYQGDGGRTAGAWWPNPFAAPGSPLVGGGAGTRLYRTGDLGRWLPGGRLQFLGRIDHQVKIRGHRIELGEIEAVLARHPDVRAAVLMAREDAPGDKRLVAYVVPRSQEGAEDPEAVPRLRNWLGGKLPDSMVPSAFVLLDVLPLTPNGKIDRNALPKPERQAALAADFQAPESGLERQLADAWKDVLGVDRVGLNDNFFELGGHSLLMARLRYRLREGIGRDVALVDLFNNPTVGSLARFLSRTGGGETELASGRQAERLEEGKARLRQLRQGRRPGLS